MPDQPWKPSQATTEIRRLGSSPRLKLTLTLHAKDQMRSRDLVVGDVLFLLKHGFVYANAQPAAEMGIFKYKIECETPNSHGRSIRSVVIPDHTTDHIKVVTVMWVDE